MMPMYLLDGDKKALESVIKEQRIRIGRGLITITPARKLVLFRKRMSKRHSRASRKLLMDFLKRTRGTRKRLMD